MKALLKTDLRVILVPTYVEFECPYCEEEIEREYSEICDEIGEPPDWTYSTIECPHCEKSIEIDDVDWD